MLTLRNMLETVHGPLTAQLRGSGQRREALRIYEPDRKISGGVILDWLPRLTPVRRVSGSISLLSRVTFTHHGCSSGSYAGQFQFHALLLHVIDEDKL